MTPMRPVDNKSTSGINQCAPEFAGPEQQQQHTQTIGPEPIDHFSGSTENMATPHGGYAAPSMWIMQPMAMR